MCNDIQSRLDHECLTFIKELNMKGLNTRISHYDVNDQEDT